MKIFTAVESCLLSLFFYGQAPYLLLQPKPFLRRKFSAVLPAFAAGLCGAGAMTAPAVERRDRVRGMLADLKVPGALEAFDGGAVTAREAIEQLLTAQIRLRNNRRLETAMRASRLPAVKTLAEFDFTFQPSIKREQIESLHGLGFLQRAENVILLGPPGVGKTHLAISLAIAAAQAGRRVYYGTLAGLIDSLIEAKAAGNLSPAPARADASGAAGRGRDRLPAGEPGGRRVVLPVDQRPA